MRLVHRVARWRTVACIVSLHRVPIFKLNQRGHPLFPRTGPRLEGSQCGAYKCVEAGPWHLLHIPMSPYCDRLNKFVSHRAGHFNLVFVQMRYTTGGTLVFAVSTSTSAGYTCCRGWSYRGREELTLAAILRLVEPCGGTVEIDGVDVSTIPLRLLRQRVCVISQDPLFFTDTLRRISGPIRGVSRCSTSVGIRSGKLCGLGVFSLWQWLIFTPCAERSGRASGSCSSRCQTTGPVFQGGSTAEGAA